MRERWIGGKEGMREEKSDMEEWEVRGWDGLKSERWRKERSVGERDRKEEGRDTDREA